MCDFDLYVDVQFGVKIGKGFIKKEYFGVVDNCVVDGNMLMLIIGQGFWFVFQILIKLEDFGCFGDFFFDFVFWYVIYVQVKVYVFFY